MPTGKLNVSPLLFVFQNIIHNALITSEKLRCSTIRMFVNRRTHPLSSSQ